MSCRRARGTLGLPTSVALHARAPLAAPMPFPPRERGAGKDPLHRALPAHLGPGWVHLRALPPCGVLRWRVPRGSPACHRRVGRRPVGLGPPPGRRTRGRESDNPVAAGRLAGPGPAQPSDRGTGRRLALAGGLGLIN